MASLAAEQVAMEVLDNVRKGEKPNLQKIQIKHGYSKASAKSMKVKETQTYKDIMKTVVESLELERERIIKALTNKDLDKEKYRDLIDGLDKITKNTQLLSGGTTENISVSGVEITIRK